jgi:hypothetical protein
MTACLDWLAAEYLHRAGLPYPDPPCGHDQTDCVPLTDHHTTEEHR